MSSIHVSEECAPKSNDSPMAPARWPESCHWEASSVLCWATTSFWSKNWTIAGLHGSAWSGKRKQIKSLYREDLHKAMACRTEVKERTRRHSSAPAHLLNRATRQEE